MNSNTAYASSAMKYIAGLLVALLFFPSALMAADPVIIDHTCTDIRQIPESAILQAKADLHIAYGHTSHGSQLTSGMGASNGSQLDAFMTSNGATPGLYLWNNGGSGGALDLHNYFVSGDLGNPDRVTWAARTRAYLAANPDVNVIIWSWCGQAATSIANIDIYLNLMEGLINDYPHVDFVFMTGHLDGTGLTGQLHLANEHIRNHCVANGRILYDFADIESYDPDWASNMANYMALMANDNCDYDGDGNGSRESNWAIDWQSSHVEGVDWWPSGAAHSQHLNGNLKGYAAWWLWATLAGWNTTPCVNAPSTLAAVPDTLQEAITLTWQDNSIDPNETEFIIQRRFNTGAWNNHYARVDPDIMAYTDTDLVEGLYDYRVVAYYDGGGQQDPCSSSPSNTASVLIASSVPDDPSDLSSQLAGNTVDLTWSDNSGNEDHFIIERSIDGGGFSERAHVSSDTTSFNDTAVAALHTYTYRVRAVNGFGDSNWSNETSIYVPEQAVTVELRQNVDGYTGCTDVYLDSASPDTNFGTTPYKSIGNSPPVNLAIKFDLPAALLNKSIHEARLIVYCWSVSGWTADSTFDLFPMAEPWDENTASWNERQTGVDWLTSGGTYDPTPVSVSIQAQAFYPEFDITPWVQQWSGNTAANNGMILCNTTPVTTGIKASEYSEYGRPSLLITYSAGPPCRPDQDGDQDVDGVDLATFASMFDVTCLEEFATGFGSD